MTVPPGEQTPPGIEKEPGIQRGRELAVEDVNASHVLGQVVLSLDEQDDGGARLDVVVQRLASDARISAILGPGPWESVESAGSLQQPLPSVGSVAHRAAVPILELPDEDADFFSGFTNSRDFVFSPHPGVGEIESQAVALAGHRFGAHSGDR